MYKAIYPALPESSRYHSKNSRISGCVCGAQSASDSRKPRISPGTKKSSSRVSEITLRFFPANEVWSHDLGFLYNGDVGHVIDVL